jgi:hypothetical protein
VSQRASAGAEGLGSSRGRYGSSRENAIFLLIFVAACALGGLILLAIGLTRNYIREVVFLSGGGLLALLVGGVLLFVYQRERRVGVEVFDEGLVYTDRRKRRHAARWDDVTEVYEMLVYQDPGRASGVSSAKYTLHLADGRKLKLGTSLQDILSLGRTIKAEVGRRLLPRAIEAYRVRQTVSFGPKLSLSQEGVTCRGEKLPWSQVSGIKLRKGVQINQVGRRRPWKSVATFDLANRFVLRELLGRIHLQPVTGQPAGSPKAEAPSGNQ